MARLFARLACCLTALTFAQACGRAPAPVLSTVEEIDESLVDLDLLEPGPHGIVERDYALTPSLDPLVPIASTPTNPEVKTQLAGRVYLPSEGGEHPVLVFLHGNHSTCGTVLGGEDPRLDNQSTYTISGVCPEGMIPAPSYRGYDTAARLLASHGYAVVSIDANRGITGYSLPSDYPDRYLIGARGKLVLRTLAELRRWNDEGSVSVLPGLDLQGRLDLTQVGLMGHSRGGEGVRSAQLEFRGEAAEGPWHALMPELAIRAVFEIAPVDFGPMTESPLTARDVAWSVLIAACDGDVVDYQGIQPWHRAVLEVADGYPKSVLTAWGANHNYFNSQWQVSDAKNCAAGQTPQWDVGAPLLADTRPELADVLGYLAASAREGVTGSPAQIRIGAASMLAFFRANVGEERTPELGSLFDPQFRLPALFAEDGPLSRAYGKSGAATPLFRAAVDPALAAGGLAVVSLRDEVEGSYEGFVAALAANPDALGDASSHAFTRYGVVNEDAVVLSWDDTAVAPTWELELAAPDLTPYWTLDLVVAARGPCAVVIVGSCDNGSAVDASVELVAVDGSVSSRVKLSEYVALRAHHAAHFRKTWTRTEGDAANHIIQYLPVLFDTVRIELADFDMPLESVRAVRLIFDQAPSGSLIVDDVNLIAKP